MVPFYKFILHVLPVVSLYLIIVIQFTAFIDAIFDRDECDDNGWHQFHESYYGDRDTNSLVKVSMCLLLEKLF